MNIILQKEKQTVIAELQRDEAALRAAVSKLHDVEELTVPSSLEDISNPAWVRAQINPRITLIKGDASLTADEQRQRQALWLAVKQRALRAIEKVSLIIERWPGLSWLPDESGKNFHLDQPQVDELATERATREVPAAAEEHWRLISAMRSAVEQLRDFEQQHQVKDMPLLFLSRFDENRLYTEWITGNILIAHRVIAGRDITARKVKELYY